MTWIKALSQPDLNRLVGTACWDNPLRVFIDKVYDDCQWMLLDELQ